MASPKASGSGTERFRGLAFSSTPAPQRAVGTVLITGFGPFPGVARNASAALAAELARLGSRRHRHLTFVSDILPVDWCTAPVRLEELLVQHRPLVALHFGVSPRATGFVIETHAYNETKDLRDEAGRLAGTDRLVRGDRARRTATLPVRRVVQTLQDSGYPAELSSDPGRYLCNSILFHSLRHAVRAEPRTRSGFIHIPATLDAGTAGEPSLIGWADALEGGVRLMDVCLASLRPREITLS